MVCSDRALLTPEESLRPSKPGSVGPSERPGGAIGHSQDGRRVIAAPGGKFLLELREPRPTLLAEPRAG